MLDNFNKGFIQDIGIQDISILPKIGSNTDFFFPLEPDTGVLFISKESKLFSINKKYIKKEILYRI